jgi:hypothetical protein
MSRGISRVGRVYRHDKWIKTETIMPSAPVRWKVVKLTETWAKIPHHQGLKLAKQVGDSILAVLLILEAAIHNAHSNQVELTNGLLKQYKISRQAKTRGLRQLAAAGAISVVWRGHRAPIVIHHWYTERGKLKKCRRGTDTPRIQH